MQQESAKPQSTKPSAGRGTKSGATKRTASKPKKRTSTKAKPKTHSKGLGDTIAKVTEVTGIDKVVKAVAGDDCGCAERREALNKLFPYAQPMSAQSVKVYEEVLRPAHQRNRMSAKDQHALMGVYAQIFGTKRDFSTCGGCVLQAYKKITKAYEEYCQQ